MLTMSYRAEKGGVRKKERQKLDTKETKCLRSRFGVTRRYRMKNKEVRRSTGLRGNMGIGCIDRF